MDFMQKAKDAIKKFENINYASVTKLTFASDPSGIHDVKATAYLGKRIKNREYTMDWDADKEEFVNVTPKHDLYMDFMRQYGEYRISQMAVTEIFDLLKKANRRRKSAERKVRQLRAKAQRINNDAMTAISSRHRTIEEQWEVMRELQRRGLVSTEDIENVIYDVTGMKRIKISE